MFDYQRFNQTRFWISQLHVWFWRFEHTRFWISHLHVWFQRFKHTRFLISHLHVWFQWFKHTRFLVLCGLNDQTIPSPSFVKEIMLPLDLFCPWSSYELLTSLSTCTIRGLVRRLVWIQHRTLPITEMTAKGSSQGISSVGVCPTCLRGLYNQTPWPT